MQHLWAWNKDYVIFVAKPDRKGLSEDSSTGENNIKVDVKEVEW